MAIRPTFYGFEMARSALTASQRNIDVTGQNIANINTAGFSRQRVELSAIGAGGINWKYGLAPAENVGLGVNIDAVRRVRDSFLDIRYRKEAGDFKRYELKADILNQIEGLLDEQTTDNIDSILSDFQYALQEFNQNGDEVNFASNVRMIANTFVKTMSKVALDLNNIKDRQVTELGLVKDSINQLSKAMNDINLEIRNQTIMGVVSNELLDLRDMYVDELAKYGNVVAVDEYVEDDNGNKKATGGLSIYFGLGGSDELPPMLVNGLTSEYNTLGFEYEEGDIARLTWETGDNAGDEVIVNRGMIMAYYEMLNGTGDVSNIDPEVADIASKGIPFYMEMLNNIASVFADTFNTINEAELFVFADEGDGGAALNIRLAQEWQDDAEFILKTLSDSDAPGAARADNLARFIISLKDETIDMAEGFVGSFQQYVKSLNSEVAIEVNYNNKLLVVSDGLLLSIENLRESVMGVSEDEEAMHLAKFQKSYTAAARYMNVLDEMLDVIVNRLGIVGR